MEKYKYDESNGLWYELQGDYYLPCLKLPEEKHQHIGIWGQRHHEYLRRNKRIILSSLQISGELPCNTIRFCDTPFLWQTLRISSTYRRNCDQKCHLYF